MIKEYGCTCSYCHSPNVVKHGKRLTKNGRVQIYRCKDCGRYFSESTSYERVKLKKRLMEVCVNLRSLGLSYRNIQKHLEVIYGVKVSHATVFNWVKKYERNNKVC